MLGKSDDRQSTLMTVLYVLYCHKWLSVLYVLYCHKWLSVLYVLYCHKWLFSTYCTATNDCLFSTFCTATNDCLFSTYCTATNDHITLYKINNLKCVTHIITAQPLVIETWLHQMSLHTLYSQCTTPPSSCDGTIKGLVFVKARGGECLDITLSNDIIFSSKFKKKYDF